MDYQELAIPGAWVFTPRQFPDERGSFLEWFAAATFQAAAGRPFRLAQANHSISSRGVLRGVHFADVPPGQAKYVYCTQGAVTDFVIDLRVGSPSFGLVATVTLDTVHRRAVYLSEGLGHAFLALEDASQVCYLCSTPFNPSAEHDVNALDPALGLPLPVGLTPLRSAKDAAAPDLATAQRAGILPDYEMCLRHYASLAGQPPDETRSGW